MSDVAVKRKAALIPNPANAPEKKGFPVLKVVIALLIIVAVVLIALFVVNAIVNSVTSRFEDVNFSNATADAEEVGEMRVYEFVNSNLVSNEAYQEAVKAALLNYSEASAYIKSEEGVRNFLISAVSDFIGYDRASAIILVSVTDDGVKCFNIEGSTLAYIPSVGVGPIADAYEWGGTELLAKTVMENYGVQIDGAVELNLDAFEAIVDELGTITVGGEQLDGAGLVDYVRASSNSNAAMNQVVSQVAAKLASGGLFKAKDCVSIMLDHANIYMNKSDASAVIKAGLSMFGSVEMVNLGTESMEYVDGTIVMSTCDYATERATLVSEIYG